MNKIPTFSSEFEIIERESAHEGKLIAMLEAFINSFPVENAYLFRYSSIGYLGEGVIALENNKIHYIHEQRYDLRTLPAIMNGIREKKASFTCDKDLVKLTPSNHVINKEVTSFLAVPILQRGIVTAFIYSNLFKKNAVFDESLLEAVSFFGKKAGELIHEPYTEKNLLSKREFAVMKDIANGYTAKEIAHRHSISESTIDQYIKQARKKLNASNRAHAVSVMFRLGIL